MKILSALLHRKFNSPPLWFVAICTAVALVGFADATYLTVQHYLHVIPPCTIGGCETVLTSTYSTIAGIPIALLGVVDYLILLTLLILFFDSRKPIFLKLFTCLVPIGFIASFGLVYLQAFVIHAWCLYCLVSAGISSMLFFLGALMFKKYSVSVEEI